MKNYSLLILLSFMISSAQEKSTGLLNLSSDFTAELVLNNSNATVTLQLTGPNDRWFAFQFGSFEGGMQTGTDVVYWNNVELVDAVHNGVNFAPSPDSSNDWVLVSNENNSPSAGLRSLVYTRTFDTGDTNDYVFSFNDSTLDIAWAKSSSPNFTLNYHGPLNRDVLIDTNLQTLGVENSTIFESVVFPNPASDYIEIKSKVELLQINVYNQIGTYVKSFKIGEQKEVTLDVSDLQTGIYFFEIENITNKAWKKVQILN